MKILNTAHASYRVSDLDAALHFYIDCLGMKQKLILTYADLIHILRDQDPEGNRTRIAGLEPRRKETWLTYVEVAPHEYIELFAGERGMRHAETPDDHCGYLHLSLEVDDIFAAQEELQAKGVPITSKAYLGPEHTYQMWIADPDGNPIEMMQYTKDSLQLVGNV
jgi:catechol 2,3-dioxygenase-like lactoylglutathione lyase family enzyme